MNAREAMQALLDGKTMYLDKDKALYKFDCDGNLMVNASYTKGWVPWLNFEGIEIYEEYPLTFEQALTAMLDGKIVMCSEPFPYAYRFHNGRFESAHVSDCFTKWEQEGMPSFKQNAKWKVVG